MARNRRIRMAGALAICLVLLSSLGAQADSDEPHAIPDAQIRRGDSVFVGYGILNSDASSQQVNRSGIPGRTRRFYIRIQNAGSVPATDGFKVKRSGSFQAGYKVRYFDATNRDVTGMVNKGIFTTPALAPGAKYRMRATVKLLPGATVGSNVTRLITFSDPTNASVNDAVRFTVARPGPAVRFSVTGLVAQPSICVVGPDCGSFPSADYPRQVAKITALDAWGNIATGYSGTVSFETPLSHVTPHGLSNMTLKDGIGYVPVLVPSLSLGYYEEPFNSNCPSGASGNGLVLTATDTVDPSIFGCQNIPGGDLTLIFPNGFADTVTPACPTGCFADPTDNIVIDPTFITPLILTPNINSGGIVTALVGTSTDYYATVPISIGNIYVQGIDIPSQTLAQCTQCSTNLNYLQPNITISSSVPITEITPLGITFESTNSAEFNIFWDNAGPLSVNTIVTNGLTPTCFQDIQATIAVSLALCNETP